MKKIIIAICLFVNTNLMAQLEDITGKLDVHAGYAMPLSKNIILGSGLSIGGEPKFWYNDQIMIGAKLGFNFLASNVEGLKLAPITTFCIVGEKYMGDGAATYFIGASAGLYRGGQTTRVNGTATHNKASKVLGLAPRAGLQFGQYRLMGEYHYRKNSPAFVTLMLGITFGGE